MGISKGPPSFERGKEARRPWDNASQGQHSTQAADYWRDFARQGALDSEQREASQ